MTVRPATNPVESGTRDRNFTGQNEDVATGSYDFLFRRLNNIQGRWISPDPLGIGAVDPANPQSWNRYGYVLNEPLNMIDYFGLDYWWLGNCLFYDQYAYVDGTLDSIDTFFIGCYGYSGGGGGGGGGPDVGGGDGGGSPTQPSVPANDAYATNPPKPGGTPETCSYYEDRCKQGDTYSCDAAQCCRDFGNSPKANPLRECLMTYDFIFCPNGGIKGAFCRTQEHIGCYLANGRVPWVNINVPRSCTKVFIPF